MSSNPLLSKMRLPGETFQLPSQGLFYPDGVLSDKVENGEIHVYPMNTYNELMLRSADAIYSGQSIVDVFSRCIPDVLDPLKLHSHDVDFLLTCLRVVSYGPTMEISYKHNQEDADVHIYEINVLDFLANSEKLDPTITRTVKLDSGHVVTLKPAMTYKDSLEIDKRLFELPDDVTNQQLADELNRSLSLIIESVDDVVDIDHITEWFAELPPKWVNDIKSAANKLSKWGINPTARIELKDCDNQVVDVQVSTNPISFFG